MTLSPAIDVNRIHTKHANGYNLSVANYGGAHYRAYRWHPKPDHWRTEIAIECDGETLPLMPPPGYEKHSIEDPRFFAHAGGLYMSITIARSRVSGQSVDPCVVGYGMLVEYADCYKLHNWIEPSHRDNTWSKQTKNLVFWEQDKNLFMTWQTSPAHVVHLLDPKGKPIAGWRTESPKCPFGNYRGGTPSFGFEGNRLRFCHAVQNNRDAVQYWHYSLCAYVYESKPPFRILKVSQQPILTGNESYRPNCPHWKARICIPYGAVWIEGGWRVSLGLNDCECATVDLTREDLNL